MSTSSRSYRDPARRLGKNLHLSRCPPNGSPTPVLLGCALLLALNLPRYIRGASTVMASSVTTAT